MGLTTDEIEAVTAPFLSADLAQEVRSVYDERLSAGEPHGSATAAVFDTFRSLLADPDEGPVVFLAVAAVQLRERSLLDPIRDAALALIEDGDASVPGDPWMPRSPRDRKAF